MVVSIKSIKPKDLPIVVKLITKKVKAHDIYPYIYEYEFEKSEILIHRIFSYNNVTDIYYFDGKSKIQTKVPASFNVEILKESDLYDKYSDELFKELSKSLSGNNVTIGSDPEIFVRDEKENLIPAFEFLPKRKNAVLSLDSVQCYNNKVYWDGFQAEFDTWSGECLAWQVDSIRQGLKTVLDEARKHNPKAKLSTKVVEYLDFETLDNTSDEHAAFGCDPVLNVYGHKGVSGLSPKEIPYRSAGGHIHFGTSNENKDKVEKSIKALDAILGVACVSLFGDMDDPMRRQMYGLAGEYRLPKHGIEYRVLSNTWLCHPLITNIVFDLARKALKIGQMNLLKHWKFDEEEVIRTINSCDVEAARKILEQNKEMFMEILKSAYYGSKRKAEFVNNIFLNGIGHAISNPNDLEKNWNLTGNWINHSDGEEKNVDKSYQIFNQLNKKLKRKIA